MQRGIRRVKEGIVIGHGMDKTAVVQVVRVFRHPKYLKTVKTYKKFLADDPNNEAKIGDAVEIAETRPISKRKFHRLLRIVGKSKLKLRELPKKKEKTAAVEQEEGLK